LAFWQLGQKKAASDALVSAGTMGLKPIDLSGFEKADYEELARKQVP